MEKTKQHTRREGGVAVPLQSSPSPSSSPPESLTLRLFRSGAAGAGRGAWRQVEAMERDFQQEQGDTYFLVPFFLLLLFLSLSRAASGIGMQVVLTAE